MVIGIGMYSTTWWVMRNGYCQERCFATKLLLLIIIYWLLCIDCYVLMDWSTRNIFTKISNIFWFQFLKFNSLKKMMIWVTFTCTWCFLFRRFRGKVVLSLYYDLLLIFNWSIIPSPRYDGWMLMNQYHHHYHQYQYIHIIYPHYISTTHTLSTIHLKFHTHPILYLD